MIEKNRRKTIFINTIQQINVESAILLPSLEFFQVSSVKLLIEINRQSFNMNT